MPDAGTKVPVNPESTCTDAGVQASDYDQTCALDSDCVAVGEGLVCQTCAFVCPTAAINKADMSHYTSDLEHAKRTQQAGSGTCHCPALHVACCLGGTCHANTECSQR
jgi:hypothetical protein